MHDFPRLSSRLLIWLALFAALPRLALAVIVFSTGDPTHNTTAPTGALTNSGWQYQGTWGVYLGTPIAPKYFMTAAHVGGTVGDVFHFRGVDYATTAFFNDTNSDLRIWRVCGSFPDYASLYSLANESGKPVVVFGRGTQRGEDVVVTNFSQAVLKGWQWGASDNVQRWGTNVVTSIIQDSLTREFLKCTFDADGGADEGHLSVGDSGGGVFVKAGAIWKLAGINYGVDGPFNTSTDGGGFFAAIFDEGGLYQRVGADWVFTTDVSTDLPSAFYSTRVSARLAWINSVIDPSATPADPPTVLFSASDVAGPYAEAPAAVVDTNAKTVTLPQPASTQFYRLQACAPSRITGITISGTMLVISYQ
jgi:hypothetical protein